MSSEAVFVRDGERYRATELALGPWYPGALHGGAPAALLASALAAGVPDSALRVARVTYEFVRPVPLGELSIELSVVRPGRRVTLLERLAARWRGNRGHTRPGAADAGQRAR
jgi:acyl-coenzyme A thioesterase PaaI-like protein